MPGYSDEYHIRETLKIHNGIIGALIYDDSELVEQLAVELRKALNHIRSLRTRIDPDKEQPDGPDADDGD